MDEIYKSLSVRLYDVMEHVGASEKMRQLHKSTAIQEEISHTVGYHMEDLNGSVYIFGSFMEGSTTSSLNPDIDVLRCDDRYPLYENIADARAVLSFLMVRDVHTRPGYVKLQQLRDGVPQTVDNRDINHLNDSDYDGRICMKHYIDENADERNGPANTLCYNRGLPVDTVAAYRCRLIPSFADKWLKLKREFNWPSSRMLDNMTSSGCFVVGVGHPASDEQRIEWRLSFSLQERYMMLSLNPTQHKCYILLKMVKKDIIVRKLGKCVSSYHLKTCIFHLMQHTRPGIWIPTNLFLCFSLCLNVLLKWVRCGYCPNYFIKEENMFDRDVHREVKQPLSDLLDRMIQDGPSILLDIKCDNIQQYLIHPERLPASVAAVEYFRSRLLEFKMVAEERCRRLLLSWCVKKSDGKSTCLFLKKQFQIVKNASVLNRKPDNYRRQFLTQLETYIHSRIGSSYMSLAFDVLEPGIQRGLRNLAEVHFQQGQYCDMTSSRLMYASVLYTDGQYDRCVRLLEEIDADLGYHVVSSCSCHLVLYTGDRIHHPLSYVNTASCVIFLPSNRNITPAPLLPEMYRSVDTPPGSRDEKHDEEDDFWFDCAAVDGKVYQYFLKYLAYTKMHKHVQKQVAIDKMKQVLETDPNLGHRETALNLLGWILVQENRIVHGIWWFLKSWEIRPIHNAAKWHLAIAVYNHIHVNKQNKQI